MSSDELVHGERLCLLLLSDFLLLFQDEKVDDADEDVGRVFLDTLLFLDPGFSLTNGGQLHRFVCFDMLGIFLTRGQLGHDLSVSFAGILLIFAAAADEVVRRTQVVIIKP